MERNLIEIKDLSVTYDGKEILKDINISIPDLPGKGQCIAILGRSGRGKSTLFRNLTGLESPTSGTVKVLGSPVTLGQVGFVDQRYTVFRHKTVLQTLQYSNNRNLDVKELSSHWGLGDHLTKYPNQLSGGQRQRLAILEQYLSDKTFLILDEPFSGLDVKNIDTVKGIFSEILSSHDHNTIIFSTHDIQLASELADLIFVIGGTPGTVVGKFYRGQFNQIRDLILVS